MLLTRLALCDFGVFEGEHVFDLAPRRKYGSLRPIILFGGLNGTGKTTILTAVRLALYGRASLGLGTSQREYSSFLSKAIHRNSSSLVATNAASVSLEFDHAHLGERSDYRVVRSWLEEGRACEDRVTIFRESNEIQGLSQEQAQAFLNQLVPPGVSQFFFFDGEKIASLATGDGDQALRDSIGRLLGLDLVERLRSDLGIYARQIRAKRSTAAHEEIAELAAQLDDGKQTVARGEARLHEEIVPAIDRAKLTIEKLNAELSMRGGAWAQDRGTVQRHIDALLEEKRALEDKVKENLTGFVPLALAPTLSQQVTQTLKDEITDQRLEITCAAIKDCVTVLRDQLFGELPATHHKKISEVVRGVLKNFAGFDTKVGALVHRLGETESQQAIGDLTVRPAAARAECAALAARLEHVEEELANLTTQLARAPAETSLKPHFDALTAAGMELGRLEQEKSSFVADLRREVRHCIDLARKLKALEEAASDGWSEDQAGIRVAALRELMSEFGRELARLKLRQLRAHFIDAFGRLARKEDLVADAEINEEDFSVTLIDHRGQRIPKESLSAGECQIYAIAMLEALARTSGRNLPVIIDTPLGRLDSKHRKKLVEQYFPCASHQVIVLSTDTEVDEPFYQGMAGHVSHAYHLVFDDHSGTTKAEEGYFWKHLDGELRNVA
jgi:DNA sulfur modification protein DndD